ncbi:MAG: ATP-binding protein, partial [Candidatus Binatia bacterium]
AIVGNGRLPRQLTEPERRLLTSMADQIGPAIDNVNLFEEAKSKSAELERRNREVVDALERQTAVAEMLRAMAHTLSDLQSFFDTMIADTVRLTRAAGGVIRLADNTGALRYVAHYRNGVHRLCDVEQQPLPADENGAAMQAYRQQTPVQFNDILEQPPPLRGPISTATRTVLAVPLLQEGVSIGVIVVFRHFVEPFTEPQVELVTTFADQAVVAIKNINLFQELEARTRELESANERLKELDKLKSGFVSNVSHELRTPLTVIGSLVDNMLDGLTGPLSAKQARYMSGIKDSTERLARLIHDLLDLSVIESGRMEIKPSTFQLSSLITEVVENLRPVARDKAIELDGGSPNRDDLAWADRDKVTQVLTNLVTNAVKFTPHGGRVRIFLESVESGYWLQVGVSDNGPGIPPEEAGRIFDEFYQISHPGREKAKGVGLGLAICKKLIDMHGGQIRVESTSGAGSTFYFTVPAHVEQSSLQAALN